MKYTIGKKIDITYTILSGTKDIETGDTLKIQSHLFAVASTNDGRTIVITPFNGYDDKVKTKKQRPDPYKDFYISKMKGKK